MENNNQNNQDIKLCPACGAKNKAAYKYCNECAAPLNQDYYTGPGKTTPNMYNNGHNGQNYGYNSYHAPQYNYYQPPNQNFNGAYYNGQFNQGGYTPYSPYETGVNAPYVGTPDFDGVSAKDVYDFTGRKSKLFFNLRAQHFSGKLGPYCWPLFFLGLFLGFFGVGCWFLYHKMYKPAVGFVSAGVANLIVSCYSAYSTLSGVTTEQIREIFNSPYMAYDTIPYTAQNNVLNAFSSVVSLLSLVLAIVLPFFAYKWYKNHVIEKIREEYTKSPMPNIFAAGGFKSGLIIAVSVTYGAIYLAGIAFSAIPFMDKVFKVAAEELADNSDYYSIPYDEDYYDYDDEFSFDDEFPFGEDFPFGDDFEEEFPFGEDFFGDGFGSGDFDNSEELPFTEDESQGEYW